MARKSIWIVLLMGIIWFACIAPHCLAQRYVWATISLNGNIILEEHFGDAGHVTADVVWERLKTLHFTPTEAFANVKLEALHSNKSVLKGDVEVFTAFGGEIKVEEISFHTILLNGETLYKLSEEEIDHWSGYRKISRDHASLLDDRSGSLNYLRFNMFVFGISGWAFAFSLMGVYCFLRFARKK